MIDHISASDAARALAALGAAKGGRARANVLTAKQRARIAQQGGKAYAALPPEKRSAISKRGWETRRKKQDQQKTNGTV